MRGLKRFFVEQFLEENMILKGELFSHLKVLRVSTGEMIVLVNGVEIGTYLVEKVFKNYLSLQLVQKRDVSNPVYKLKAYISVLKRDYMDFVMEKMGEIGATEVVPTITRRSIRTLPEGSVARYKRLLINGAMQSEIDFIPKLLMPADISSILPDCEENILFYERGGRGFHKTNSRSVSFFIGPEGGLESEEVDILLSRGFKTATPFPCVLKAETAAIIFGGMLRSEIERSIP